MRLLVIVLLAAGLLGCEGKEGPVGPQGPQGIRGNNTLSFEVLEGTILNRNYTAGNSAFAAIYIGVAGDVGVLSFATENANGVFVEHEYSSVIFGFTDEYTVGGQVGYYILVSDANKRLLNANYKAKVIQYTEE